MSSRPAPERVIGLLTLSVVLAGSCAVFPDKASLPSHGNQSGSAGAATEPQAGAGEGGAEAGRAGEGPATGGSAGTGGSVDLGGAGPGGDHSAGAGGAAGGETCFNPNPQIALASASTWITSAKPGTGHAGEVQLSVAAGADEHRALIALALPAAPVGAVLRQAMLVFRLESNADAGLSARRLGLHQLEQPLDASHATWTNYGNGGSRRWTTPGGDFGAEVGHADLDAETQTGLVSFDMTASVSKLVGAAEIPLSLIVLESSAALPSPAELAFVSAKGDTADVPRLILQYCDP